MAMDGLRIDSGVATYCGPMAYSLISDPGIDDSFLTLSELNQQLILEPIELHEPGEYTGLYV